MNGNATKQTGKNGFTLIEVAIVTVISGLIFMAVFNLYAKYLQQQQAQTTEDNIQLASDAIGSFEVTNRYPCPSDRTLPKTDPNFGKEIAASCNLGPTGLNLIPSPVPVGWAGKCISQGVQSALGTNGVGGVCAFRCSSPTCGDGTGDNNNIVVIGGIPINSINTALKTHYSTSILLDGWGYQMDYVVTYKLTNAGTYKYNLGAISVVDENGNPTAGFTDDAHYGIVSHGPDGIGAYTINGQMFSVCGARAIQSYNTGDDQNCSNNAKFIAGIRNDSRTASHYDDMVYFVKSGTDALWTFAAFGSSDIRNNNQGRVNVGTNADPLTSLGAVDPNVALFVGDPAGGTSGILHSANNSKAKTLCDKNGTNCFDIKALTNAPGAGQAIQCPAGQAMTGITTVAGVTSAVCAYPDFTPQGVQQTCPVGQWLAGLKTDGTIICQ